MNRTIRLLVLLALATPALAQAPAEPRPPGERLRQVFTERLRQGLQLTDEQAAQVVPKIEAIQRARSEGRREKLAAGRDLRQALRDGSPDATIEKLLVRLDEADARRDQEIRARMKEVDAALSPRQRAELRFFIAKFTREVDQRIRGDRAPARRPVPRVPPQPWTAHAVKHSAW